MNAAIIKRGRRYAVRLDLGRGPDGRRIYKYHSGYPTRRTAQQARTELLGALERRSYVATDKTTVAEYLRGQWLPAIQSRVRPGTRFEPALPDMASGSNSSRRPSDLPCCLTGLSRRADAT